MTDVLGPANADHATTSRPTDTRTFGSVDTWFQPCTSADSADGTEVEAAWLNGMLASLRGVYRGNGNTVGGAAVVTEDNADVAVLRAVQHLIQRGQTTYAAASGGPTAYTATLSPAPPELKAGMRFEIQINVTNTGAATLNVNALGAKTIVGRDGQALEAGDLPANLCTFEYNGTSFVLMNGRYLGLLHYGEDSAGSANTLTVSSWSPAMPVVRKGVVGLVKVAHTNTGATTLNGTAVKRVDGSALQAGDIYAGGIAILVFDGTYWQLTNPVAGGGGGGQALDGASVGAYQLCFDGAATNGPGYIGYAGIWVTRTLGNISFVSGAEAYTFQVPTGGDGSYVVYVSLWQRIS